VDRGGGADMEMVIGVDQIKTWIETVEGKNSTNKTCTGDFDAHLRGGAYFFRHIISFQR
jgi:hypothetical protein